MKDEKSNSIDKSNFITSLQMFKELSSEARDRNIMFSIIEEEKFQDINSNTHDSSTCLETLKDILMAENDEHKIEEIQVSSREHFEHPSPMEKVEDIIFPEKIPFDSDFEKLKGKNVCDAFIISGLDEKRMQFVKDSKTFNSSCAHPSCGILKAFKPKILHKFPSKQLKDLDLSETVYIFKIS